MQKYTEYFQQYWVCSQLKTRIYLDYPGRQSQAACNFLPRKSSESLHRLLDKLNCNKQLPQRIRNTITISPSSSSLTMIVIYIYILVKLMTIISYYHQQQQQQQLQFPGVPWPWLAACNPRAAEMKKMRITV